MKALPSFIEDSLLFKMPLLERDSQGKISSSVTSQHIHTRTRRRLARILKDKKKLQRQA